MKNERTIKSAVELVRQLVTGSIIQSNRQLLLKQNIGNDDNNTILCVVLFDV